VIFSNIKRGECHTRLNKEKLKLAKAISGEGKTPSYVTALLEGLSAGTLLLVLSFFDGIASRHQSSRLAVNSRTKEVQGIKTV